MIDSWYCLDPVVLEGMIRCWDDWKLCTLTARPQHPAIFWHFCGNVCMSRGALQKLQRRSRYSKQTKLVFCTRYKEGSENRSSRFEPKISLISSSRGSGPPLRVDWTPRKLNQRDLRFETWGPNFQHFFWTDNTTAAEMPNGDTVTWGYHIHPFHRFYVPITELNRHTPRTLRTDLAVQCPSNTRVLHWWFLLLRSPSTRLLFSGYMSRNQSLLLSRKMKLRSDRVIGCQERSDVAVEILSDEEEDVGGGQMKKVNKSNFTTAVI